MGKMQSLPATELVSLKIEGPVCYIELNREDKYNAMNVQMITELCEIFEWTAERSVGTVGELFDESGDAYLRSSYSVVQASTFAPEQTST